MWNYGSIAVLAVSGFAFSTIIAVFYNAEVLGVFNQVYAYYLLLSQLAACGIHMSVLKYASERCNDEAQSRTILLGGLIACTGSSLVVQAALGGGLFLLTALWGAGSLVNGLWCVLPALILFSLNKVLLSYINARSKMRAYAIFQALRNVFIALAILLLTMLGVPGVYIPLCFLFSETALAVLLFVYIGAHKWLGPAHMPLRPWIMRHYRFGIRIMPGNLVLEFNSKIDIICLGWVLGNDAIVGYYSFASLFTEGFYSLYVVVRRNLNPVLSQIHAEGALREKFSPWYKHIAKYVYIIGLPSAALLVLAYYLLCLFLGNSGYQQALVPLLLIVVSMALNGSSIVLGNILAQCGYPSKESIVNIASVATNLFLNLICIYFLGMIGAAIATAASYYVFALLQRFFVRRILDIKI